MQEMQKFPSNAYLLFISNQTPKKLQERHNVTEASLLVTSQTSKIDPNLQDKIKSFQMYL